MEKFWTLTQEELFKALKTSTRGLTKAEAEERLSTYGFNKLEEAKKTPLIFKFLANFYHLMALLLWAASFFAFLGGQTQLGWAIIGVIIINAIFSFFQEYKAEKAVEALKKLMPLRAKVLRDGRREEVAAEQLVPGDILLLEEGDHISADARVIEEHELRTDNSTLTGESEPVKRSADPFLEENVALPEVTNLVFAGTSVAYGRGKAVVFATGMQTQFGKIARLTQRVEAELTPLQKQINATVMVIAVVAVVSGLALFFISSQLGALGLIKSLTFAIGMIVANVPEGLLPTVTLALAVGVQRMAKRHAIIKKLSSVETLGSTTVICTDKTGTLTQNEMTVRALWYNQQTFSVTGVGYEPKGDFYQQPENKRLTEEQLKKMELFWQTASFCNNAKLLAPNAEDKRWRILGDPTEAALLVAAKKSGFDADSAWQRYPRVYELPFDSKRKRMSSIQQVGKEKIAFVKGAPKEVLDLAVKIFLNGQELPLDAKTKQEIIAANDNFAAQALRVIALAYRRLPETFTDYTVAAVEKELTFLGLMAMMDPPRPEVERAVKSCQAAGIRVIMITGDYGLTAESIGRRIGLIKSKNVRIVTGAELDNLTDSQLAEVINEREVLFARVSPEHKMRVAAVLKSQGQVVAMTGDGVNDAPALRRADIGVAMGITGTDVAKEAAEMIVTDDNFASIVNAIEEGRVIFDNMRKFIVYIFAHLTPEIIPFVLFVLLAKINFPLGITVMQILAIDLGTETLPALALGVEPPEPGIMSRPPRSPKEGLVTKETLFHAYIFLGLIEAALVMAAFLWFLFMGGGRPGLDIESPASPYYQLYLKATTMTFLAIVGTQIGTVFAARTTTSSLREVGFLSNRWILAGIAFELLVVVLLLYTPLARFFGMYPLGVVEWLLALTFAPIILIADELRKAWRRRKLKK